MTNEALMSIVERYQGTPAGQDVTALAVEVHRLTGEVREWQRHYAAATVAAESLRREFCPNLAIDRQWEHLLSQDVLDDAVRALSKRPQHESLREENARLWAENRRLWTERGGI